MKNLNEIKKLLNKKSEEITIKDLQQARELYKKQAQIDFKDKNFTVSRLMMNLLKKAFFNWLDNQDEENMKEFYKSIFIQDNGYNVQLSRKNEKDEFENILNIKIVHDSDIVKLVEEHNFTLR